MKRTTLTVLCLSLLLFHTHLSLARGRGSGKSSSSGSGSRTSSRHNTQTNTHRNSQGSNSHGGNPRPSGGHGGRSVGHSSHQYPQYGSPYRDVYGHRGEYDTHRSGFMNQNPKNTLLSPRFGGRFGHSSRGYSGGSPFSQSVQAMNVYPSDESRRFGRTAFMAVTGGAMVGMALGYGLGRFPYAPFKFRSHQEEYYYNQYMYKKYGTKSTDTNDYSRDYKYSPPPKSYNAHMDSCMEKKDLLPMENRQSSSTPAAATTNTTAGNTDRGRNATNSTGADKSMNVISDHDDGDDDTVSIVEIGYPSLINQMKVKKCLEEYMNDSEKYLKRVTGGVQGLKVGSRGLLAAVTSAILMLLNSNILMRV